MDDFDDLLMPRTPPQEPAALREVVSRDAIRVQRRRRIVVRGRRILVPVVCFVAGSLAMWLLTPARKTAVTDALGVAKEKEMSPTIARDPYRNDSPERLERWAFLQAGEKRADLYRRAGDLYLGRDDVEAALRCYRRALDGVTAADLAVRADRDTWLLMSLKMARQKERPDARVN
jgi:hypothetical protein